MAQVIQPISPAAVDELAALRLELADTSTVELAEELPRMDLAEQALRFRLLPKDRALAVFEELDPVHQQELLDGLKTDTVRELLESMEADDRARLFEEMPAKVATRFQSQLSAADRRTTAQLLGYEPESAGRIMTPDYVSLRASMTAAAAIERIRHVRERPRHLDVLPVTDGHRKLLGTVTLADLVSADPDTRVADFIADEHYQVSTDTDQEEAARLIQEANLIALAVVDHEDRLVGMITWDDAMEILEAEDTEDAVRGGASEPLERPYLSAGVFMLARKRAVWLLVLAVSASLTVTVLNYYESYLSRSPSWRVHLAPDRHRRELRVAGVGDDHPRHGRRRGPLLRRPQDHLARVARGFPARPPARRRRRSGGRFRLRLGNRAHHRPDAPGGLHLVHVRGLVPSLGRQEGRHRPGARLGPDGLDAV